LTLRYVGLVEYIESYQVQVFISYCDEFHR